MPQRFEARDILTAAGNYVAGNQELPKTAAAKRWLPWLCAYTGARIGEMAQLRKADVFCERLQGDKLGVWVLRITPEAGAVKDKQVRTVPLHPHLIELGFPDFVIDSAVGYLFLNAKDKHDAAGVTKALVNRLREFIRTVVADKRVAPNHAWRHTFKTTGREAGIDGTILDAICGHAPKSVGDAYGDVTVAAMTRALGQFPPFTSKSRMGSS